MKVKVDKMKTARIPACPLPDLLFRHCKCTYSSSPPIAQNPLPTRCIRIDGMDSQGRIKASLEETLGLYGTYITLSHRWNSATEECKTTLLNFRDRVDGNELQISRLCEDTLVVAFELGIKYVWIDSLCIIQDGNDFEKESLKMAQYYQGSIFTLAAVMNSVDNGLELSETSSLLMPRLARLPYRDIADQQNGWFYVYNPGPKLETTYEEKVLTSELLSRDWLFKSGC